jgi:hypothetical protein
MFGQMPCSRWSHVAVSSADYKDLPLGWDSPLKDTLFIFGGISLNSYCRSKLYSFKFEENEHLTSKEAEKKAEDNVRAVAAAPDFLRKFI